MEFVQYSVDLLLSSNEDKRKTTMCQSSKAPLLWPQQELIDRIGVTVGIQAQVSTESTIGDYRTWMHLSLLTVWSLSSYFPVLCTSCICVHHLLDFNVDWFWQDRMHPFSGHDDVGLFCNKVTIIPPASAPFHSPKYRRSIQLSPFPFQSRPMG